MNGGKRKAERRSRGWERGGGSLFEGWRRSGGHKQPSPGPSVVAAAASLALPPTRDGGAHKHHPSPSPSPPTRGGRVLRRRQPCCRPARRNAHRHILVPAQREGGGREEADRGSMHWCRLPPKSDNSASLAACVIWIRPAPSTGLSPKAESPPLHTPFPFPLPPFPPLALPLPLSHLAARVIASAAPLSSPAPCS